MDRRTFLKNLAIVLSGVWAVVIAFPIFRYLQRPPDDAPQERELVVGLKSELPPGTSKTFKFGNKPGLLVCDQNGNLNAFEAVCTHLACTVQYRTEQKDIFCACHGGVYGLDGGNVSGPPPKPLRRLKVAVKHDGNIVVSKA